MPKEMIHPNGERLIFRRTGRETGGKLLEMEAVYNPESSRPPLHYHPQQDEHFEVLSGVFRVRIGKEESTFSAGETFVVPRGTPHRMHNIAPEEGRLRWQIRPALNTQAFFETLWGLAADGQIGDGGLPGILQLAVVLHAYRREFRPSAPPAWVQRIFIPLLAFEGRRRGYRSRYDEYSDPES